MHQRELGRSGLRVAAVGLGVMPMSEFYGAHDDEESLAALHHAIDIGVAFWDTSDIYGPFTNEQLIGRALRGKRDRVVLATKFGVVRKKGGGFVRLDSSPKYVPQACDASLERLGTDYIDLYYQHRVDPQVPIEETVGAMARLVEAGKVRHLGLSEAAPATLRRAAAVHPITALQTEYSLWTRDVEPEILPTCRELGIGLVAYSPLGRGFLTGTIKTSDDLGDDDWRRVNPRFAPENLQKNLALVEIIEEVAAAKGCTPAQLALAWLLLQGLDVVPIPGTRRKHRIEENAGATEVALSADDLARLDAALPPGAAAGTRYDAAGMSILNG